MDAIISITQALCLCMKTLEKLSSRDEIKNRRVENEEMMFFDDAKKLKTQKKYF